MFNSDDWGWGTKVTVVDFTGLANIAALSHGLLILAGSLSGTVRQVERDNKSHVGAVKGIHTTIGTLLTLGKNLAKLVRVEVRCAVFKHTGGLSRDMGLFGEGGKGDAVARVDKVADLCDWLVRGSEIVGGVAGGKFERWTFGGLEVLLAKTLLRSFRFMEKKVSFFGPKQWLSALCGGWNRCQAGGGLTHYPLTPCPPPHSPPPLPYLRFQTTG